MDSVLVFFTAASVNVRDRSDRMQYSVHVVLFFLSRRIGQVDRNPHPPPFSLAAREKGAEGGLRDSAFI